MEPPKKLPDFFENKFIDRQGEEFRDNLWSSEVLGLLLTKDSCLKYYVGNKASFEISLSKVNLKIFEESFLEELVNSEKS